MIVQTKGSDTSTQLNDCSRSGLATKTWPHDAPRIRRPLSAKWWWGFFQVSTTFDCFFFLLGSSLYKKDLDFCFAAKFEASDAFRPLIINQWYI